jgi:glycerol-1-phosphate dehydrogenase [NAD(P)+]
MDSKERIAAALKVATDTKVFEMGEGILGRVPEVFKELFPGRKAVVVADINTWPACGKEVFALMEAAGIPTEKYIIEKEEFHAEWRYIEMVDKILDGDCAEAKRLENDPDYTEADARKAFREPSDRYPVAVSVGAGVINDLCKLTSHHHGQGYVCVATAASVDGFSSFGASITYQNAKQTFECAAPTAILADLGVLADAPKWMAASGYADLAAKVPAGAEWMIADLMGTEPIIPAAWDILYPRLHAYLSDPEGIARGDHHAIADIFEGLTMSGFAMQAARSSRPASCCEHLFSHILDMTHHRFHGKLQSHGIQVAVGTLTMCAIFDELFKFDLTKLDVDACVAAWPTIDEEQMRALEIFRTFPAPKLGYTEITKKYNDAETVRAQLSLVKKVWPEFKKKLQAQVWSFEKMQKCFAIVGAPTDPSDIGVTRHQLHDMFPKVQLMRWRFNALDLAKRGRYYDELVNAVFLPGHAWDINEEKPFK